MTDNTNSTNDDTRTDDRTTTTTAADAPAPKLAGDKPRARPEHIDTANPNGVTHTNHFEVAATGPFAGIARFDLDAPAALFHVAENAAGDRYVAVRHHDAGIPVEKAEEVASFFAEFYDLDHPAMKPGTLVAIYENLEHPAHGGGANLGEGYAEFGPDAANIHPDPRVVGNNNVITGDPDPDAQDDGDDDEPSDLGGRD